MVVQKVNFSVLLKLMSDQRIMFRGLCLLLCAAGAAGQPTICFDGSHCNEGYYCDSRVCRECLHCGDLMRSVLPVTVKCVTSVTDCGPCLPGLVNDPSGNVNAACVPEGSMDGSLLTYVWAIVALVLVLLAGMVAIVLYVLRHPDTLKILASTRASLQTSCSGLAAAGAGAAPREAPPPYSAPAPPPPRYRPVRPTSPALEALEPAVRADEESARPFIKRADSRRERSPRERDSNQEARVFNNPSYIRGPVLPSYDSAYNGEESSSADHDDTTMESVWAPNHTSPADTPTTNTETVSSPPSLSVLLSEARGTTVVRPAEPEPDQPANKVLCVRQDSNNNGRAGAGGAAGTAGTAGTAGGAGTAEGRLQHLTALNFNITVQQHNDVKLIST